MYEVRRWYPIYNGMDQYIGRRSAHIAYYENLEFARAVMQGRFPEALERYYDDAGADVIEVGTGLDVSYAFEPAAVAGPVDDSEIPF